MVSSFQAWTLERKAAKRSCIGEFGSLETGNVRRENDAVSGVSGSSVRDVYKQFRNFEPHLGSRSWFEIEK